MNYFMDEAEAIAQDMSRITGGRWTTGSAAYEDGVKVEYIASFTEKEYAAIYALRHLMGDDTDEYDCAHIFDLDGRVTRYSLLDLDLGYARREAGKLKGTIYEGEARGILRAVLGRHGGFLSEARAGKLCKRNNHDYHFKIIDAWDRGETGFSRRKKSGGGSNTPAPPARKKSPALVVKTRTRETNNLEDILL
jgi:hypothetical protein